jgi:site-specific DNA recombinase
VIPQQLVNEVGHLVPNRHMRAFLAVISAPSLQLFHRGRKGQEPVSVQTFGPEPPVQGFNASVVGEARIVEIALNGRDTSASAKIAASIVRRIDVRSIQIVLTVDVQSLLKRLCVAANDHPVPLQMVIPVRLKRSGLAMRLVLQTGQAAVSRVDKSLVEAVATARKWWQQLLDEPQLRISGLARANQVTNSWITRIPRLAFPDPAIVDQILAGKAPAKLTAQALRSEESIPALWGGSTCSPQHRSNHLARGNLVPQNS